MEEGIFTEKEVADAYKELPEEVRTLLRGKFLVDASKKIQSDLGLSPRDTGEIMDEVYLVILGLTNAVDLKDSIEGRIEIDESKSKGIIHSVNEQVLKPIREIVLGKQKIPVETKGAVPPREELMNAIEDKEEKPKAVEVPHTTGILVRKLENVSTLPKQESASTALMVKPTPPRPVDPYREPVN